MPVASSASAAMKDLILVDAVDEDHVVDQLVHRYERGEIYTFLGPVLIAINPYKTLLHPSDKSSLYAPHWIKEFSGKELHLCEPHPFAIAESAYTNLMRFGNDQSLLITGESGSGKTETSKHVMQYLTAVSTRGRARSAALANRRLSVAQREALDAKITHVTDVLWGSNPVLEAFGNAQTIRNHNSSRFGKYIVLQLNRLGQVVGGYIDNYLLERSRVIHQAEGERNFHAFYQLLAGATDQEREDFNLLAPEDYAFLGYEDARIEGVDDAVNASVVRANMEAVGVTADEQHAIFQQLAAILWLGNITFLERTNEAHNKYASVEDSAREALQNAARLLGLPEATLEQMITNRSLNIYGEEQVVLFDKRQAEKLVHSLARSLYELVFNWLVKRINSNAASASPREIARSIGILDIYGFEIFEVNAFEQLCINYVNEKLQQLFIAQTLRAEQDEYKKEAVNWAPVTYVNNQVVCDLIEDHKSAGIFRLLDEQCAIGRLSELELIERYNQMHQKNPNYVASRTRGPNFSIVHYAGQVEYDVTRFFESNVDTLFTELYVQLGESSVPFVCEIFRDNRSDEEKRKRPPSTSQQFRAQVSSMLTKLEGCNPHYIRCIKPNAEKKPLVADRENVAEQVRYLGLVENLSIRRKGFCYRETYATFVTRYRFLSKETWPVVKSHSMRKAAVDLLSSAGVGVPETGDIRNHRAGEPLIPFEEDKDTLGGFACGRNKIFLRHPEALSALEILREQKIPEIVNILENAWRRYKNRLSLVKFAAAEKDMRIAYEAISNNCQDRRKRRQGANDPEKVAALRAAWAAVSERLLPAENRLNKKLADDERDTSVAYAQSLVRAYHQRRQFLRLKQAQIVFSKRYRGLKTRKQLANDMWRSCKVALLGVRTEFERFLGKKKRRRDSLDREYLGDYLQTSRYPAYAAILNGQKHQPSPQKLLFAATVMKVNERFVHQQRAIVVSDVSIFNLKADKVQQPKERRVIELSKLSGVVMSTLPDNYVVLQVKSEFDMLIELEQKTELVQLLRTRVQAVQKRELPVKFADSFEFNALKGKPLAVKFTYKREARETTWSKVDKRTMHIVVGGKA